MLKPTATIMTDTTPETTIPMILAVATCGGKFKGVTDVLYYVQGEVLKRKPEHFALHLFMSIVASSYYRCLASRKLNIQRLILREGYVLNFPNGHARLRNVGPHFALYLLMSIVASSYYRCLARRKLNIQ